MVFSHTKESFIPAPYPQKLPKAVVFDWDNTLVDTWRICYEAFNHTCAQMHHPSVSPEDFYNQPHLSVKDSFPIKFGESASHAESVFYSRLNDIHLESLRPMPGAQKLLKILQGKNIYIGVVSNKEGNCLRKEVKHLGWDHYFGQVIGSRDTPEDKPSKIPLVACLEKSPCLPSHDVWFVGDSAVDTLCAQNAGCIPVAVGPGALVENIPTVFGKDCLGIAKILANL